MELRRENADSLPMDGEDPRGESREDDAGAMVSRRSGFHGYLVRDEWRERRRQEGKEERAARTHGSPFPPVWTAAALLRCYEWPPLLAAVVAGAVLSPLVPVAGGVGEAGDVAAGVATPLVSGVTAGLVADELVEGDVEEVGVPAAVPLVTGVMVTPVTLPEISDFFFLLSVPLAMRVARAFAVAAARAATERG